jgi:hypothetical protein
MRWLFALLICCAAVAHADEPAYGQVSACYNYGCSTQATVRFSAQQLQQVDQLLASANDAGHERQLLAQAIGQLYAWAGEQTPIHADRAGNYADAGVSGEMDCIDHSTTTTRFLRMLEQRGALHFHRVSEVTRRGWIFQHFTATIEEWPPAATAATAAALTQTSIQPHRFAVDSWFVDNGKPAIVLPLEQWFSYGDPGV